jgi:hypothetical protein
MPKMVFQFRRVALIAGLFLSGAASCAQGQHYNPDGGPNGGAGGHAGGGASGTAGATAGTGGGASGTDGGGPDVAGDGGGPALDCPALDNPAGGSVAALGLTTGSVATYMCNLGMTLKGATTRTCQADGTWSDAAPSCSSKDCGPLVAPKNGTVMTPTTTFGATATYACMMGYGPSGSSTRTCQVDGTWTGTDPTCVVANCPALPGPTGGMVLAPTLTFGSTATYSCGTGYTLTGTATSLCQNDGTWSGTVPTCVIKDCGTVKAPTNGAVAATTTTYGSTATFSCGAGYLLSGAAAITCQPDGAWSAAAPTCGLKNCGALTPPTNGTVDATVTTVGSTAAYACTAGYGLTGGAMRTCQDDGTWSATAPGCTIKNCGALTAPTNGSVAAPVTTYGATATYSCIAGYGPSGSSTRTCGADGMWSGTAPACVVANCPALASPTGGSVSAPTLTVNSTATYACGAGYDIAGAATRTCQANGSWSGMAPTCTIKNCGALTAPANGAVSDPTTTYGATATYSCDAGYAASGGVNRTCQADGTWSGTVAACTIKNCGVLTSPTNGSVTDPTTTYGASATYACTAGYNLVGSATRTCQADGTWSGGTPSCALKDCGALAAPTNGSVSDPATTVGATATYSCVMGYGPSGSSTRTCQTDGTWSGTAPTCILATCPSLAGPSGGSVVASGLTFMSTATYSCDAGYLLAGSPTRTCQASGFWSGTAPTCNPVDCLTPGAPQHGTVTAATTTLNSIAQYACNAGYDLNGATTRKCQTNGAWNGVVPTCAPKDCNMPSGTANGSVSASVTTFGATATYTCATNYALSPAGAAGTRTCQSDGTWSLPVPVCADVCSVTGVGSASHCCNNGNCPLATPVCNTGTHACAPKPLGGTCSVGTGECGSNPCVNDICCQTTCNGICDTGSCTGAGATCGHKPVRTECGKILSTNPTIDATDPFDHGNDIRLMCDANGQCKGPTVHCAPNAPGVTMACDTTSKFCCNRSDGNGGGILGCSASVCDLGGVGDSFGESCNGTSDCPLGNVCCLVGGRGYEWFICRPSCDQSQACGATSTCPAATPTCGTTIYEIPYCQ